MKKIIFFDTETTGNEPKKDFLCQLAFKTKDETFCEFFKPLIPIPPEASAITHITNKMVADKPAFKQSNNYETIKLLFEDPNSVVVAHNAKFDIAMNAMCSEVNNMIMDVNNMYALSKQDAGANASGYSDNAVEKAKSLVKLKQEKAEKKMLRQRAKLEHQTLPEFIRLVDYIEVKQQLLLSYCTNVVFYLYMKVQ